MNKLLQFVPAGGEAPLPAFLRTLDGKLRAKVETLFMMLVFTPTGLLREPYVKHFTIERYCALYELRARGKAMVRIIFTIRPGGDILFLAPFIKNHKRNTMQALDTSLKMLSQIEDGSGSTQELTINKHMEVVRECEKC